MTQQSHRRKPEVEKHEARANQILDAASSLVLRYGSHKVTIEGIAREAGIGKGTLYLHWNSREALFAALILREKVAMAEDIKQRIAGDPQGASLHGLLKHAALALLQRPLLKAALLRDTQVFGEIFRGERSSTLSTEVLAGFTAYLETLQELGLVRADLSLHALGTLFSSIFLGFFLAAPHLPDAYQPSDQELAELIAETGHRALEPRQKLHSDGLHKASHTLDQYLADSVTSAREQLQVSESENEQPHTPKFIHARGRKGGRTKKLQTEEQIAQAQRLYADNTKSIKEICSALRISRATFYRYLKDARQGDA